MEGGDGDPLIYNYHSVEIAFVVYMEMLFS